VKRLAAEVICLTYGEWSRIGKMSTWRRPLESKRACRVCFAAEVIGVKYGEMVACRVVIHMAAMPRVKGDKCCEGNLGGCSTLGGVGRRNSLCSSTRWKGDE
jgi:hypothetical protein